MLSIYLDEDSMRRAIVNGLRARGFDVVTTAEAGMTQTLDDQQLDYASEQGRVVLSSNARDFHRLHRERMAASRHHAGIILVAQRMSIGDQIAAIAHLAAVLGQDGMRDRLEFLRAWVPHER